MVEFLRLTSDRGELFEAAFGLYEISFPLHEQRPPDKQRALMPNSLYHFEAILDGGAFAGIVLSWNFDGYSYVEHFAIHPDLRGKNLGSKSLALFCDRHPLVALEIDPPVDEVSIRRETFYKKLGFHTNSHAHAHPPYRPGFAPHPLVVMTRPRQISTSEYDRFAHDLAAVVMADVP